MNFDIEQLRKKHNISDENLIYQYLKFKTKSVDKDSKARRSLGNIYALKVLIEDFIQDKKNGSSFSELLERQKKKPFGSKIQNHPLDNRLNDEFVEAWQGKTGQRVNFSAELRPGIMNYADNRQVSGDVQRQALSIEEFSKLKEVQGQIDLESVLEDMLLCTNQLLYHLTLICK